MTAAPQRNPLKRKVSRARSHAFRAQKGYRDPNSDPADTIAAFLQRPVSPDWYLWASKGR